VTHSELAALELQARIMGWEPAVTENVVIEVPGPLPAGVWDRIADLRLFGFN
jgi:hypothetical protein